MIDRALVSNDTLLDRRTLPKAGEKWRQFDGRHYLVQGVSKHADSGETLVICRSLAPPFASLAHPLGTFLGALGEETCAPRFERVDED
jgi:hypothetical protein